MKKVKLDPVRTINNKCFRIPSEDGKGLVDSDNLVELLKLLVFNLPPDKLTMKDSISAHRFIQQCDASENGYLALEEAEHDWVKDIVEKNAPRIYGINACMIKDGLDNFDRLHEPNKKSEE